MRKVARLHELLADRFPWLQYPRHYVNPYQPNRFRFSRLSSQQKGWLAYALFVLAAIAVSIYGNLL